MLLLQLASGSFAYQKNTLRNCIAQQSMQRIGKTCREAWEFPPMHSSIWVARFFAKGQGNWERARGSRWIWDLLCILADILRAASETALMKFIWEYWRNSALSSSLHCASAEGTEMLARGAFQRMKLDLSLAIFWSSLEMKEMPAKSRNKLRAQLFFCVTRPACYIQKSVHTTGCKTRNNRLKRIPMQTL